MLVYFDESYDHNHQRLLLGACFFADASSFLTRLCMLKDKHHFIRPDGTYRELKYHWCYDRKVCALAYDTLDLFFSSEMAWFRGIAIETWAPRFDDMHFGKHHSPAMRRAIIYKKFTELLLRHSTIGITDAYLYVDHLSRCRPDAFVSLIHHLFVDVFIEVVEVDSRDDAHQLLQVTDLLLWCALRSLVGGKNPRKARIASYFSQKSTELQHVRRWRWVPNNIDWHTF